MQAFHTFSGLGRGIGMVSVVTYLGCTRDRRATSSTGMDWICQFFAGLQPASIHFLASA